MLVFLNFHIWAFNINYNQTNLMKIVVLEDHKRNFHFINLDGVEANKYSQCLYHDLLCTLQYPFNSAEMLTASPLLLIHRISKLSLTDE